MFLKSFEFLNFSISLYLYFPFSLNIAACDGPSTLRGKFSYSFLAQLHNVSENNADAFFARYACGDEKVIEQISENGG